jgi:predicted amidohydrolase
MTTFVRVAAAQLSIGTDLDDNLAALCAAIDQAADGGAELVVLPGPGNHASWWDGPAHAWQVAVELGGPFLGALAARARARHVHVVAHATVRRDAGACTATSLLFGPDGATLAQADAQVLLGADLDVLSPAREPGPVVETLFGRVGLLSAMDALVAETARGLALRGADLLCASLGSFTTDDAALHLPARAAENRVFVVGAQKIGPLVPRSHLAQVALATRIPADRLHGAGESIIAGPDGAVLARGTRHRATVVIADIEPRLARDKRRADGTDRFAARRPELYAAIADDPAGVTGSAVLRGAADHAQVAAVILETDGEAAIAEAAARVASLAGGGAELIVLPELFCFEGGLVDRPGDALERAERAVAALAAACPPGCHVVVSLPVGDGQRVRLAGIVVGPGRVVGRQPLLHATASHPWAVPGDTIAPIDLPWGRLGIAVGDDAIYPETARLLTLAGASVIAVPFAAREPWELAVGLPERAAENHVPVIAASRGGALVADVTDELTLTRAWHHRVFDGTLTAPTVLRQSGPGALAGLVHPAASANKVVYPGTDLLASRPWWLADAIVRMPDRRLRRPSSAG